MTGFEASGLGPSGARPGSVRGLSLVIFNVPTYPYRLRSSSFLWFVFRIPYKVISIGSIVAPFGELPSLGS